MEARVRCALSNLGLVLIHYKVSVKVFLSNRRPLSSPARRHMSSWRPPSPEHHVAIAAGVMMLPSECRHATRYQAMVTERRSRWVFSRCIPLGTPNSAGGR